MRIASYAIGIGLVFLVLAYMAFFLAGRVTETEHEKIAPEKLSKAINLSAQYLIRSCDNEGKFVYRVNTNPDVVPAPKYNILRHAGTIYALADYADKFNSPRATAACKRATEYLKKHTISPLDEDTSILAVWTYPEMSGKKAPVQAKLGAAGLALVAFLSVEKIAPETTPVEYMRRIGRFILFMQKKDGSFYSKYIPSQGGRADKWKSLYYPGEAALGLLMLYEIDPREEWLKGAVSAISYLASVRSGKSDVDADHWALLASAKLLDIGKKRRKKIPQRIIIKHAEQICISILKDSNKCGPDSPGYGAFGSDARTTPTATRLEGLLAAKRFIPAEKEILLEQMTRVTDLGILFLCRSQIVSGTYIGGMPRALEPLPYVHPLFNVTFNRRATEVRIDYVQHALSAMMDYQALNGWQK